jgi:hypothetical protein
MPLWNPDESAKKVRPPLDVSNPLLAEALLDTREAHPAAGRILCPAFWL